MSVWRSRWAAVGAAVAVLFGAGGVGLVDATADSGERPVTVTIDAERILDTRANLGLAGRFTSNAPRDLQVTGPVPVASGGTSTVVPGDAVAVLVNVTVVAPSSAGFLSLRPTGAAGVPTTSTVNFVAGSIEPNAATVDLGPGGKMQVWVKTAEVAGTADVLVDVVGYTIGHTHDDRYYTESEVDDLVAAATESITTIQALTAVRSTSDSVVFDAGRALAQTTDTLQLGLAGPRATSAEFSLRSIEVCVTRFGVGYVDWIRVWNDDVTKVVDDSTNRVSGCHVIDVNASSSALTLELRINAPGILDAVALISVETTWAVT